MMGHVPDGLAKILTDLKRRHLITGVTGKVTGQKRSAAGGMWTVGGGIVLPCKYNIYGDVRNREIVRNEIFNSDIECSEFEMI